MKKPAGVHTREGGRMPAASKEGDWRIEPSVSKTPDVVVYEFGCRLSEESQRTALDQLGRARDLYHVLVESITTVHNEMNAWVLRHAGEEAMRLSAQLRECEEAITNAKRVGDAEVLRAMATERLRLGTSLTAILRPVRKAHMNELRTLFFGRVGKNTATVTYQLRCSAVTSGLGWATANSVLDSALKAWQMSLRQGRPPSRTPAPGAQASLSLQFVAKGGVPVSVVLSGKNPELHLEGPNQPGRRQYGQFRFRVGTGSLRQDLGGTWQCHREVPADARVVGARLVRRQVADRNAWALQLVLRLAAPIQLQANPRAELAALHLGWSQVQDARRVMTIAQSPSPDEIRQILLPPDIEQALERASELMAARLQDRRQTVGLLAKVSGERTFSQSIRDEITAISVLPPPAVVPARRIYALREALCAADTHLPWLDQWVAQDRKNWQAAVLTARRARGRRRQFYRLLALDLVRTYSVLVMQVPDLERASRATQANGSWSDFSRHARSGRAIAALNELVSAIRWAAARHATPLFDVNGPTTRVCCACGSPVIQALPRRRSSLLCKGCGQAHAANVNAAVVAWKEAYHGLDCRLAGYWALSAQRGESESARKEALKSALAKARARQRLRREAA